MKNKIFTLSDVFFILFLLYIVIYHGRTMVNSDGDILWHIRQGEWYIENKTWYINKELFSHLFENREWPYLSWLGDVIFAFLYKYFGFKGLIIFVNFMIASSFYFIFRYLAKKKINIFVILFVILVAVHLPSKAWVVRNHIFSEIFIVIWFIIIERYYESKDKYYIWILPLINIIWVNIHASYLYGMVICAFFALGCLYDFVFLKEKDKLKKFITLSSLFWALFLTSLINPFNIRFYVYLFTSESLEYLKRVVGDFVSPEFNKIGAEKINFFIVFTVFIFLLNFKKKKIHYLIIMLYFLMTGLIHRRNMAVFGILMIFILPQMISLEFLNCKIKNILNNINNYFEQMEIKKVKFSILINYIIALFIIIYVPFFSKILKNNSKLNEYVFPVKAMEYLKNNKPEGRGFNSYMYGGYLVWNFYPEKTNFCDTRGSIFLKEELEDYYKITEFNNIFTIFEKYSIEWVFIDKIKDVYTYNGLLLSEDKVELIYEDEKAAIFQLKKDKEKIKKDEEKGEKFNG